MPKNKLLNRVIVESNAGDRAFLLLEGDIFAEQADVYVFNAYKNEGGMLLKQLKEKYEEELKVSPFYFSEDGTQVVKHSLKNGRVILLIQSDFIEHEMLSKEDYQSLVHIVFASLTALESYGERFDSVAFPVLFRNGLSNIYMDAIRILIEKSTSWLKESDYTRVIKYVLYESGDATLWNENLNLVLGRRVLHIDEFSDLQQYKNKALSTLKLIDKRLPFYEDTILPIQHTLQTEYFRPEVVAAFSRKLLEVFCYEKSKEDATLDGSLDGYLSYMRQNRLLNKWDMQLLYQIRSFGNPSIHRPDPILGPKIMNEIDVTILLIGLCKLLEMLNESVHANVVTTMK